MSSVKKLASQTAVYGLSTIAGRFFNFFLVPLYTRIFSQQDYGISIEFYAYITFISVLLSHGMETAFFRFAENSNLKKIFSTAFLSVAAAVAFFGLLMVLFGRQISAFLGYGLHPQFLWYSAAILCFDALCAIPFSLLRYKNKAVLFAVIKNLNIGINIFLNIYLLIIVPYFFNKGIILPLYNPNIGILAIFISNFAASCITFILLLPQLNILDINFNQTEWKKLFNYAWPMIIVGFAGMINETLDRIIIKFYYTDTTTANKIIGIYGASYKLSVVITIFIQAFKFAAEPFFFSHAKQSSQREIYARVMNYFIIVCFTIFLVVCLYIDIFKYYLGSNFHQGLHLVPLLMLANICLGIYYNLSVWYKLSDKTNYGAIISVIGACITVAANIILIPKYSYTGCAMATFICYFLMMIISYYWGMRNYPIPYHLKSALLYAALALFIFWLNQQFITHILNTAVKFTLASILVVVFIAVAFINEKPMQSNL